YRDSHTVSVVRKAPFFVTRSPRQGSDSGDVMAGGGELRGQRPSDSPPHCPALDYRLIRRRRRHDGHSSGLVDDLFAVLDVLTLEAGVHLLLDVVLVLVLLVLGTLAAARTGTAHHAAHAAAHTGTGTGLRRSGSAGARPAAERNSTGALPRTEAARTSCCTTTNW